MGECDRYKNYISDYLDNTLDPTTNKDFEKALKSSADLQKMTQKVSVLKSSLKSLPYHTCSEDFSVKLRERIHTEPEPIISRRNVVRLSMAFSFVVIVAFATFSLTNFSESNESNIPIQNNSGVQDQSTSGAPNPASGSNTNPFFEGGEVEVNTKSSHDASKDSSRVKNTRIPERRPQQVDQKK